MEFTDLLKKIATVLDSLKIPYAVTGGVAVTIWGRARYTADIDIIIDIAPQKLKQLITALYKIGDNIYLNIDDKTPLKTIKNNRGFNLIHPESGVKADFIIKKDDKLSKLELKRAVKKEVWGQKIYFISPEDLILIKLKWYQDSNSTRHLEDVESILKISKVDLKYIKKWAKEQETLNILEWVIEKK